MTTNPEPVIITYHKHPKCDGNNTKKLCKFDCEHCFQKSFASHPKSQYWLKVNKVTPRQIFKACNAKFKFKCNVCKHVFSMAVSSITRNTQQSWCGYCANHILCKNPNCEICKDKSFVKNPKAKFWSKKNLLEPRQVFKTSAKKYYFDCNECKHVILLALSKITSQSRWCAYCVHQKLCDNTSCKMCKENSFVTHPRADCWSSKNKQSPREVFKCSENKFIFECAECKHEFEAALNNIAKERWCPYCTHLKLCDNNECSLCLNNSFAPHPKAKHWSAQNTLKPRQVFKNTGKLYIFKCDVCKHEFETSPNAIVGSKNSWCPYCCKSGCKLCDNDKCEHCFNRSFASHKRAKNWSTQNTLKPREIFMYTNNPYIFNCDICKREFQMQPNNIANGQWCPCKKNKTEGILLEWLKQTYSTRTVINQPKFDWCVNEESKRQLPFDFLIKELNVIIELDGGQHFIQVSVWNSPEKTQKNDAFKMKKALEQKYTIIRVLQTDVWNDKNNWESNLSSVIKEYDTPSIIYVCNNNEYDCYKLAIDNTYATELHDNVSDDAWLYEPLELSIEQINNTNQQIIVDVDHSLDWLDQPFVWPTKNNSPSTT